MVLVLAACSSAEPPATGRYSMTSTMTNNRTVGAGDVAPLDPSRPIDDRNCGGPIDIGGGNLRCR
jgi:hypothetical protein